MLLPNKKLWLPGSDNKQPCLRNGYLQSRKDMMEYRNRFRFNPLAKVADMFIPKPLRMSPGYPCCCETCECGDGTCLPLISHCLSDTVLVTIGDHNYVCEKITDVDFVYDTGLHENWDWSNGYGRVTFGLGCKRVICPSCASGFGYTGWTCYVTASTRCNKHGSGYYAFCGYAWSDIANGIVRNFSTCENSATVLYSNTFSDYSSECSYCEYIPLPESSISVVLNA